MANTTEENGSTPKSTPRKRQLKATPKKQMKAKNGSEDEDDDDASSFDATPSKNKPNLNKVKNGRVQKNPARSRAAPASYAEPEDDEDDEVGMIKPDMDGGDDYEVHNNGYSNGNGYNNADMAGYGNGHEENGGAEDGVFYDAVQDEI